MTFKQPPNYERYRQKSVSWKMALVVPYALAINNSGKGNSGFIPLVEKFTLKVQLLFDTVDHCKVSGVSSDRLPPR